MTLKQNEIHSKEFFFSGDLNFNPGKTYTLGEQVLNGLIKEQLGDLIEAECQGKLKIERTLFAKITQKYVSKKFPNFADKILEVSNGLIQPSIPEAVAAEEEPNS